MAGENEQAAAIADDLTLQQRIVLSITRTDRSARCRSIAEDANLTKEDTFAALVQLEKLGLVEFMQPGEWMEWRRTAAGTAVVTRV